MNIQIRRSARVAVDAQPLEVVERKGIGHPDTLADTLADEISYQYSQHCLREFGRVAHHWVDKVMLLGGQSEIDFGRGRLITPMTVQVVGKASLRVGDHEIPLDLLTRAAAANVFERVLPRLDVDRDLRVVIAVNDYVGAGRRRNRYRPDTVEDMPKPGDVFIANDSVVCAGFAPLSDLEQLVLATESWINGSEFKNRHPETGTDVKVIATRFDDSIDLVVRLPFIADLVESRSAYLAAKAVIVREIEDFTRAQTQRRTTLHLNIDDDIGLSYLTATGTVADTGDHGVVGRGNRANGLITPNRPMSIEAPSGKNPVDHAGKVYSTLSEKLADEIAELTGEPTTVTLVTSRGRTLDDPLATLVELGGTSAETARFGEIEATVRRRLATVEEIIASFTAHREPAASAIR